jgi:hypothetical protein
LVSSSARATAFADSPAIEEKPKTKKSAKAVSRIQIDDREELAFEINE